MMKIVSYNCIYSVPPFAVHLWFPCRAFAERYHRRDRKSSAKHPKGVRHSFALALRGAHISPPTGGLIGSMEGWTGVSALASCVGRPGRDHEGATWKRMYKMSPSWTL